MSGEDKRTVLREASAELLGRPTGIARVKQATRAMWRKAIAASPFAGTSPPSLKLRAGVSPPSRVFNFVPSRAELDAYVIVSQIIPA